MPLTQITPDVVTSNVLVNAAISYFSSNTANAIVNGSTIIPYSLPGNAHANGSILGTQLANNLSISGNTNFNNVPSPTTPTNIGVVQVGSILNFTDVNIQMGLAQSVNNYTQIILQNSNTGTLASADFIVNNDSPAGTTIYGDFGINSTVFSGSGAFSDANGTYAYASGGTMSVGTYGANNLKFATNNTTQMTLDTNGNLGLGITPSGWTNNYPAMVFGRPGAGNPTYTFIASTNSQDLYIGSNAYYNGTNWKYQFTSPVTAMMQDFGYNSINWNYASANTGNITWIQAMTLDNNGNLLLGRTSATSPGSTLGAGVLYSANTAATVGFEVLNSNTSGSSQFSVGAANSGGVYGYFGFNGSSVASGSYVYQNPNVTYLAGGGNNNLQIGTNGTGSIKFYNGSTQTMTLSSSGLAVGTTSLLTTLTVNGKISQYSLGTLTASSNWGLVGISSGVLVFVSWNNGSGYCLAFANPSGTTILNSSSGGNNNVDTSNSFGSSSGQGIGVIVSGSTLYIQVKSNYTGGSTGYINVFGY
jgi:hypothetical protein